MLTTERRLGAGLVVRTGPRAAFRAVTELDGEPHAIRSDLVGGEPVASVNVNEPIIAIGHITDLHVTDAESPARFEFVNLEWEDSRFRELLTMQRPHETLTPRAIEVMVRTLNRITVAPVAGGPLEFIAMTGDAIDNTQRNELTNFLALLNGGTVRPDSGAPGYEGVQAEHWPGFICWKPDGPPTGDAYGRDLGFPRHPGLLERAVEPFEAAGLRLPWIGCYGNHEEVCQGVGRITPALARAMTGSRKPIALPSGLDRETALETFVRRPEFFMSGESIEVASDAMRRPISRGEFVESLVLSGSHGFTAENQAGETAYYVHDTPAVRFITLDTVCPEGGADGRIDPPQLYWLERRLEEAHSSFRSRDGSIVRTSTRDRLVVVLSHHGYETLANPRAENRSDELLRLLHRFGNVVLWISGHIHANRITPRPGPPGAQGFWEVTTSSLVDWPCQGRVVELFDAGAGILGIACTMIDHDGRVEGGLDDLPALAGLHRELAGNVPFNGFDSWRPGTSADRNAILLLNKPF